MRQFLFVVKNGRIAFWQFHRGCLSRRSLNGNVWNDYSQTFWDVWCEANQPEDLEDAILLSDRPDGYGKLPPWFHASDTQASKWTLETFSKVVNDDEFAGKNVKIYLGAKKYDFSSGSPEEVFWLYPREGDLSSQFAAAKEKQIQCALAEDQEKRRAAEELKKQEAELARKHAEEERRAEEARRAAEERRKREAELARKRAAEERMVEEARRAAEERRKREAELAEARRVRAIFGNYSVRRLFSEWERLCGAYCKAIPTLTYQLQQACRNCVHGIALPRNYLKDVALKFLSECVSPSFQGRGVAESVKDRGAVLGILLLHYISSSDFNSNGEEAEDLNQIYQLAQRQSIQDRLVEHLHKYLEI